ncbi:uncharacterized protein LOC142401406 [Odontesthes bonariensis]|uniref:uncharacterized protein LOC142401406 n=1 Tax=Odontesthes bonariensis TaxID=219752 RepID=UPI003F58927D
MECFSWLCGNPHFKEVYLYQVPPELELPQEPAQDLDMDRVGLERDLVLEELGPVFSLVVEADQEGLEATADKDLGVLDQEELDQEELDQEELDLEELDLEELDLVVSDQEELVLEQLDQEGLDQEGLDQEELVLEELDLEELDQEGLDQEELDLEELDQEGLVLEQLDLEELDQEGLDQEELDLEELDQEGLDQEAMEPGLVELVRVVLDKQALVQVAKAQNMEALEQGDLGLVEVRELEQAQVAMEDMEVVMDKNLLKQVVWEHHLEEQVMGLVELG